VANYYNRRMPDKVDNSDKFPKNIVKKARDTYGDRKRRDSKRTGRSAGLVQPAQNTYGDRKRREKRQRLEDQRIYDRSRSDYYESQRRRNAEKQANLRDKSRESDYKQRRDIVRDQQSKRDVSMRERDYQYRMEQRNIDKRERAKDRKAFKTHRPPRQGFSRSPDQYMGTMSGLDRVREIRRKMSSINWNRGFNMPSSPNISVGRLPNIMDKMDINISMPNVLSSSSSNGNRKYNRRNKRRADRRFKKKRFDYRRKRRR